MVAKLVGHMILLLVSRTYKYLLGFEVGNAHGCCHKKYKGVQLDCPSEVRVEAYWTAS